jgi:adenylate kinase
MKLIFVTGLPSIDKKTIIDLALQRSARKGQFKIVDFDSIGNLVEDMENVTDVGTTRQLLSKFHSDIGKVMISDLKDEKNIIVSGYLSLGTKYGYVRAVSDEFFSSFKPDSIVILERGWGKSSGTDEQQNINRYYGTMFSSLCGSTLKIINFSEKRMMDAVKELSELIKHQ